MSDGGPDPRVAYIADWVLKILKIKADKWNKAIATEETKTTINDFLDKREATKLIVVLTGPGNIAVQQSFPSTMKGRALYFMKREQKRVPKDSFREFLIVGDMAPLPLDHLSKIIEQVFTPMLANEENEAKWTSVVANDIMTHVHDMQGTISQVYGEMKGKTILSLPAGIDRIHEAEALAKSRGEVEDTELLHSVEGTIIRWVHQVAELLQKDSAKEMLNEKNPGPRLELTFWKERYENLDTIRDQFEESTVKSMALLLKTANSSYYPAWVKLYNTVVAAKEEAFDITMYLRPLQEYVDYMDNAEFCDALPKLKLMLYCVCLVWANSEHYSKPARIVVLLQEVCNMIMESARVYIDAGSLFQAEIPDSVDKLEKSLKVLIAFKDVYDDFRNRIPKFFRNRPPKLWEFSSHLIFSKLDAFIQRIQVIREMFEVATEFVKLERVELGGIKGRVLSTMVADIYTEFMEIYNVFANKSYDSLDIDDKEFIADVEQFQSRVRDFDLRLTAIVLQAFHDCSGLEAIFKMFDMLGGLLDRPAIKAEFASCFPIIVTMLEKEIDDVKKIFTTRMKLVEEGAELSVHTNMPPVAGSIKWAQELTERLVTPMTAFRALEHPITKTDEVRLVQKKYDFIKTSLTRYESETYKKWASSVDDTCQLNMDQPVLLRQNQHLAVNFDPKLVAVLREVKYLNFFGYSNMPQNAEKLYTQREFFQTYVYSLEMLASGYNTIIDECLSSEIALIAEELSGIEEKLEIGLVDMKWNNEELKEYVEETGGLVGSLENRVRKAKDNLEQITDLIESWSRTTLHSRKDEKKHALLILDEQQTERVNKRYDEIKAADQKIHNLMDENLDLFQADSASEKWLNYEDYIDYLITTGFVTCIQFSIDLFLANTDSRTVSYPFMEARLDLVPPDVVFTPAMIPGPHSLDAVVEDLVNDIFHQSTLVSRISSRKEVSDYLSDMDEEEHLADSHTMLIERVRTVMGLVGEYSSNWEMYSYLWTDNRQAYLQHFLKYGCVPGTLFEELDPPVEPEFGEDDLVPAAPTLPQFRDQIDKYELLYVEVEAFVESEIFENWFLLDLRPFKQALLNTVKRWSSMFKQHLIDHVVNNLNDLDEFVKEKSVNLTRTIRDGDYEALVDTMSDLLDIKDRLEETDKMFEPIKQMIELLRTYNEELPEEIHQLLQELPEKWANTKRVAQSVKQFVAPLQATEVANIRKKAAAFDTRQHEYREEFRAYDVFRFDSTNPYRMLDKINYELGDMEEQMSQLQNSATLFEVPITEYKQLKICRREMRLLKQLWDYITMVQNNINEWKKTLWKDINVETMDNECKRYSKEIKAMDKEIKSWDIYVQLDLSVKNMSSSLRAVADLQNPAIRQRHWQQLMEATKVRLVMDEYTTLADLLKLNLHNFEEEVRNIVDRSVKEMAMEKTMKDMNSTWTNMLFDFEKHPRTGNTLLKVSEELVEVLEDNQVQLQTLMSSKYIAFFLDEVSGWQQKLSTADQVISVWLEVQRTWGNLESIFIGSEDIRMQLPQDSTRFDNVDKVFKRLIDDLTKTPRVIQGTAKPGLVDTLEKMQADLTLCEKALADYLETKRLAFPRFYFVSSADLLDILSNGNLPLLVMQHLTKLFDSVAALTFKNDALGKLTKVATHMNAKDGETVLLNKEISCEGQVESWLGRVLVGMRTTIRNSMQDAVITYEEKQRDIWIFDYMAQVALCGTQIWWTTEVTIACSRLEEGYENALKDYYKKQVQQLNTLITILVGEMTASDRQKVMTICTIDVHARDVVNKMVVQKIENSQAFLWQSQLRHRWDDKFVDCYANICDAQFRYSHEYLGCTPRLVVTPLTDRCYITLTQSLHLIMGGAPAGPAGTGKTETTKDLGKAIGIMVYVFNCSEQMDYKSVGDIYKGLSQTGAWGCFDEFNRISVEVLSVVAVQVKCVQDAIRDKKEIFNFLGDVITLVPTVGAFITMNPGYAGRAELPENLKALFRPCAMVVPDFELICEIMFVAEGFLDARLLARKFMTLYSLCKELLSKQDHYDWGLRAIKSVLVVAGSLKRGDRERPEDQVLMRALRDFNVPKMVTDDMGVFLGLIGDLFPGLDVPRKRDLAFEKLIKMGATDLKLQPEEGFILKVVQLQELINVRHSVFVIGNPGTGKSEVWKVLVRTYVLQKRKPIVFDLDPKAVTNDELYGIINPSTREWKDGLLSVLMRDLVNLPGTGPKWIMLDGDIDPMWIESLNTVMDDNKVLTLASNERIALTNNMRMMFEIMDLKTATPATVSRAGILYINANDLGWTPFITSWIDTREQASEKTNLMILFDRYVPMFLEVIRTRFKKISPIAEVAHIHMLCYLLEIMFVPENVPMDTPKEIYELYFVYCICWAFGSGLYADPVVDYRLELSKWFLSECKTIRFPTTGSIFDYYIDRESKRFLPWTEKVMEFYLDPDRPLQAALVHTAETTRIRYFINELLNIRRPVLLVGPSGSGKTVLMQQTLLELPEDKYIVTNVPFNFYTTSEMLQRILEKPLEKKAGRNYGPPGSKRLIYFIDDLNMPEVDMYFTVQPTTIVRQHIEYGHWYDRVKLSLKDIHNCQYVACMNPTGGSFTITGRVQRHFCVFTVAFPNLEALNTIYSSILSQHLTNRVNRFSVPVQKLQSTIVMVALALHARVATAFLPTAIKFHYTFNLRDLSNIFQGVLFATGDCVKTPADLIRLYLHESARVYRDKMIEANDQDYFNRIQLDILKKNLEEMDESLFRQPLIYFHYALGSGEPKYMPVNNWNQLVKLLKDSLANYNEVNAVMNLVLFGDAVNHTIRINRILESPRGNALLVGVGGSGKQSLARLSSFISNLEVFQITLKKGYGIADLKADLLVICVKAGFKNIGTVFLMTDAQVADEKFLVLINDLLASGEVPDLYPDDEVENIINGVRNDVKSMGQLDTRENCWKFFISRLRKQLNVVLCFSPVGSTLRNRSRKFPAVTNCTSIEWFHEWPEDALVSVSMTFISEIPQLPVEARPSIAKFLAFVHISVNELSRMYLQNDRRFNYTTPKSFLEQLALYGTLLTRKFIDLTVNIQRLENGLSKLKSTSEQVTDLKATLALQEVELLQKNEAADQLIEVVGVETEKVSKEKAIADAEEEKVHAFTMEVAKKQQDCERDLEKAEPALQAAQEALNTLNKANLTELKSFGAPPAIVVNVLAAVMVLMAPRGKVPKDRSWKASKLLMAKVDQFLDDLIKYDKQNIHPDVVKAVTPYLKDPDFNADFVRSKSLAAAGLCAWAINIVRFFEIYCDVEPKRKALEEANSELIVAQDKLAIIKTKISKLEVALGKLTSQFEQATSEKLRCQKEAESTQLTITLANRLVGGLQSENVRWAEAVSGLRQQELALPGDVLRITAFVSYAGCFSRPYRVHLMDVMIMDFLRKCRPPIPVTEGLDPINLVTDESQIATWNNNEGLPSDRMSTENATILTQTQRWPLMIDPQLQGVKWIKQKYGKNLRVIRMGGRGYLDMIEQCLGEGLTTMFENIDETVDPVLDHILGRNTIKKGTAIKIGDKEVEYNKNFKLILHTKLANPHYKPEMQAQTTLINFTVTREGLEDQLLAQVVRMERPDLEELKADLTRQQNEFKIVLKELEDSLLYRLSSAEGNILGDTSLVENLEHTKRTAAHIAIKVAEAKKTEVHINTSREDYRPAATRGSILYFIMNELNKINPIYQFSLKAFNVVLERSMGLAEMNDDAKLRVASLTDSITYNVFQYTNRGLFEKHKIIFTGQTTFQIMLHAGEIPVIELDFLLRFPFVPNITTPVEFLTNVGWGGIKALSQLDDFRGLDKDIEGSAKRWRKFVDSECPEREKFPQEWKNKTPLQRMCMMRALRPDRMIYNMIDFIADRMGTKFTEGRSMEFSRSWEESGPGTPIFFILSLGVDPLKDVEALGKKLGWTFEAQNFHNVSLGQGQEPVAEAALEKAYTEGHWVILQNIHLVRRWLQTLEKKVEAYANGSHPDYRVYVSAEPAADPAYHIIPQGLLENSIKITNEPPTGIKANLHKALYNFDQETLEMCSKEAEFKSILFSLCYFHAVVAERRKFGPQGWNRGYPFNVGDLTISVSVLYNYLENNQRVPWVDLRYLFGEIMYGGHITDDWDRKLCRAYLEEYMKPEQLEGDLMLAPGFLSPPNLDYNGYHKYIDDFLPSESPNLYGLHPNAEIGFLTDLSNNMFRTLLELQPKESGATGEGAVTREEKIKQVLDETLDKLPDTFNMFELSGRVEDRPPYVVVALQECERMNYLISEIRRSLKELDLGLKGELTITSAMDNLANALFNDLVADNWEKRAYPSLMGLGSWYADLLLRVKELEQWTAEFQLPPSVWLGGLFNPQSFLTSVMQTTARKSELPLDKMCVQVDVTKKVREDFTSAPREGAYIHALFMEGARWDLHGTTINDSFMKELFATMPVIYVKAIHVDKQDVRNMYQCPVYKTRTRGPTYVWTFNLKSRERTTKWIMGGVCLLLQI